MLALFIIGFLLVIGGIILGAKLDKGDGCALLATIPILIGGLLLGVGIRPMETDTEIILAEDINYKSIDLQGAEYYIVDNEGNIYEVTQEQWNELDVPIIPMINK